MLSLVIETATEKALIAIFQRGRLLWKKNLVGGPLLSKYLAGEVKELLDRFSVGEILFGKGPGSYTGIRVGASLALSLGFAKKIPCHAFSSLKTFVPPIDGPFASLIDAKMGGVYTLKGHREGDNFSFESIQKIARSEIISHLKDIEHFASPSPSFLPLQGSWFETVPDVAALLFLLETDLAATHICY